MKRIRLVAVCMFLVAAALSAQCAATVATPISAGGVGVGTMFNVVNVSAAPVVVTGFEQVFGDSGTATMAIYTKSGTWAGFQATPGAWTGFGGQLFTHAANVYVPIPLPLTITIGPGATQAFYIVLTSNSVVEFGVGVNQINSVIGSDSHIQVTAGIGTLLQFNSFVGLPTAGRLWSGRVTYMSTANYQVNSAGASFDVGGAQGDVCSAAVSGHCYGAPIALHLASPAVSNGYEIIVSGAPLVTPGTGASVSANGQILNVNLADPSTIFLWNLTFPPFPSPFGASSSATVMLPMPALPFITAQMAIFDFTHPDGFRLSQPIELHGVPGVYNPNVAGPAGDDVVMTLTAGSVVGSGCSSFIVPALPLYGVIQSTYHVSTNGRLTWPTANSSFAPTVPGAQASNGMIGCWADFDTTVGGNITLSLVGNAFVAAWHSVSFHGQPGSASTFSISIDSATGVITLSGLLGIANQATLNMFLGASRGVGATDSGMAAFGPGGSGAAANATAMLYRFGLAKPSLAAGANVVTLTPNGAGNYTWTSN